MASVKVSLIFFVKHFVWKKLAKIKISVTNLLHAVNFNANAKTNIYVINVSSNFFMISVRNNFRKSALFQKWLLFEKQPIKKF